LGNIVIFTDDPGWHGKQLQQAFADRGHQSFTASLTECQFHLETGQQPLLIPGCSEELPGAAFVRGVPGGSLEEVVFYLDILHALQHLNIPVYNGVHAIERSVDKAMTSFLLHNAGISTPLTWVLRDQTAALRIAEAELDNSHLLVSKPLFGSQGEGIRRLEKMTDLLWLTPSRGIYYLQRFVDCLETGFADYRVFVINNRAVAGMRRRGKSWLNNVACGGSCEAIDLDKQLANLACKACDVLAMDYAGVDIILDREGRYTVIEVNSIPAWKGLQSVSEAHIAGLLADDLINRKMQGL